MRPGIDTLKKRITEIAAMPDFVHREWYVKWHLQVVERLALELCEHYPQADKEVVEILAWLHDYGMMVDPDNEFMMMQIAGRELLVEVGLPSEMVAKATEALAAINKQDTDPRAVPVEAQILVCADSCSRLIGPYYRIFWNDALDKTYAGKTLEERNRIDLASIEADWKRVTLPVARAAFQECYELNLVQCGKFPAKFFGDVA